MVFGSKDHCPKCGKETFSCCKGELCTRCQSIKDFYKHKEEVAQKVAEQKEEEELKELLE